MANEQIEEIIPESRGGSGESGGNPMIPAIAVLVLMPIISYVLTKFIFIPQIQAAVTQSVLSNGGAAVVEADTHAAVADPAAHGGGEAKASDAHGGAAAGEEAAGPSGNTYQFEGIIANLSGSSMNRYVRVSFIIEGNGDDFASVIESNRVKLIDATITVLSSLTSLDLQNPGVKNHVRSKLMAAFDAVLRKRIVEGLYFSEFVVQ
jgi:flagellar basal body-associated protein FliL